MKTEIEDFLDKLTPEFEIILQQAVKYIDLDDKAGIRTDGAVQIFNMAWIAPMNYGLLLFPPAPQIFIQTFEIEEKITIPQLYKDILTVMNGCFVYDFTLFGLPESVYKKGLLNRTDVFQLDIGEANNFWNLEYDVEPTLFHFGGRAYSDEENIGYFIDNKQSIISTLPSGQVLNSWSSFKQFITDEVLEAEVMMRKNLPKELTKK